MGTSKGEEGGLRGPNVRYPAEVQELSRVACCQGCAKKVRTPARCKPADIIRLARHSSACPIKVRQLGQKRIVYRGEKLGPQGARSRKPFWEKNSSSTNQAEPQPRPTMFSNRIRPIKPSASPSGMAPILRCLYPIQTQSHRASRIDNPIWLLLCPGMKLAMAQPLIAVDRRGCRTIASSEMSGGRAFPE